MPEKSNFEKVHEAYEREDAKGNFIKDNDRPSLGKGMAEDAAKAIEKHQKEIKDEADRPND